MTGGTDDFSSIKPIEFDLSVNIYPNPIVNQFTISAKNKILSIRIHSLTGQDIYFYEPKLNKKEIEINSSDIQLEKGIYLITVETEIGVETMRVMKE